MLHSANRRVVLLGFSKFATLEWQTSYNAARLPYKARFPAPKQWSRTGVFRLPEDDTRIRDSERAQETLHPGHRVSPFKLRGGFSLKFVTKTNKHRSCDKRKDIKFGGLSAFGGRSGLLEKGLESEQGKSRDDDVAAPGLYILE